LLIDYCYSFALFIGFLRVSTSGARSELHPFSRQLFMNLVTQPNMKIPLFPVL
jgi:hypothetical protein